MKKNWLKRIAAVGAAMGMAVSSAACGMGTELSSSTEDMTRQYRSGGGQSGVVSCKAESGISEEFAEAYMDFSLEVLKKSRNGASGAERNTMISPLSVMMALEMTRNGAAGETLSEMEAVLYPGITGEEGKEGLTAISELVEEQNERAGKDGNVLRMANSIWFHTGDVFTPNETFLQTCAQDYDASIYGAPFDGSTLKDINRWVENETDGEVKDILDEIPEDAIMYLINAVAFEAEWQDVYEEFQVRDASFYGVDGIETTVSMMYSEEHYYLSGDRVQGVRKPYTEGYSFVALLPDEGTTLEEYLAGLDGATLLQTIQNEDDTIVETALPKFESETDIELSEVLEKMGMPLAFDEDLADFSRMGSCVDGLNICINRVLHKTHIKVDELGTKAGAATVVEMTAEGCAEVQEIKTVILNRPFLYAIIENETGLPVFIGTVDQL